VLKCQNNSASLGAVLLSILAKSGGKRAEFFQIISAAKHLKIKELKEKSSICVSI
jgi:hypothetical protein